jgi:hypothetical protein
MAISIGSYNFEGPCERVDPLRNDSGVYVILGRSGDGQHIVLDVGESSRVKDRVHRHDRRDQWGNCGFDLVCVAVLYVNESMRLLIERVLRMQYKPPCGIR